MAANLDDGRVGISEHKLPSIVMCGSAKQRCVGDVRAAV
ncbi:hypothetical protein AVDCRST_MAG94-1906 [uncultured Leptolyngbya sp.]|uniref:Uncharacterized protein n=1 Tax=uncultured Leptolyngbya sp. TaxID=332963 RepID=A0A6J4LF90_9CYAN|nr:hypothetical protein AVDCRST_MAG94-1906 [uncultured Leptolyngbya sp.]